MRRYLLTLSGLAFCVSPLFAQEYIDLEANYGYDLGAQETVSGKPAVDPGLVFLQITVKIGELYHYWV